MAEFQQALLATVEDLADYIGEPIDADEVESKRAEMTLRFASMLVRDETRQEWPGSEAVPDEVRLITLAVASRGFLNPESWGNERVDDWGAGARPIEELGMYLTGTEKRALAKHRPARSGLSTVSTFRGDLPMSGGTVYVPTAPPGVPQTPFPWY